jgi:D-alanine-D-alanine ligase
VRVALVCNLLREPGEAEAEFDTPETVAFLAGLLESHGHDVEPVDAGVPLRTFVERLTALRPDLVFNSAEGRSGRFREAFFPALYEELGLAYTGSDAWACAVTLDKRLTKLLAAAAGVRTPAARFVRAPGDLDGLDLAPPLIVKPNFEGSSMGVHPGGVVEDLEEAERAAASLLSRFPDGVLVEEFVTGRDIAVAFLRPVGVLAGVEYEFADPDAAIYHFSLKNERPDDVEVRAPASLTDEQAADLATTAGTVFEACGVRDVARADFRIDADGRLWFLEVNALPSLERGAGIYAAARLEGLGPEDVVGGIVESALRRQPSVVRS